MEDSLKSPQSCKHEREPSQSAYDLEINHRYVQYGLAYLAVSSVVSGGHALDANNNSNDPS